MKRKELLKLLTDNGWKFLRHGGSHDIYVKDGHFEQVPRHSDIKESLAKFIIRKWGLRKDD